jgi:hypothetical protein
LLIVPGSVKTRSPNGHPRFAVDLHNTNVGNINISSPAHDQNFEYPHGLLSKDDEDYHFRRLDAGLPDPTEGGSVIFPHARAGFVTVEDSKFTTEQWNDFLNDKIRIYIFVEYKYLVDGHIKITECCMFYQNSDFPTAHMCIGHNNWRWQ